MAWCKGNGGPCDQLQTRGVVSSPLRLHVCVHAGPFCPLPAVPAPPAVSQAGSGWASDLGLRHLRERVAACAVAE